ncbi:MAG: HD domain-containing protein [Clostridia bacterium]|nr:HD domain-containing protein [Lachnospiraceae bacterium]NCC01037.1 HD domain-containing protein [Clostridia bacterium]NCD02967.1 HD domain-containing protein [Clostridia bacterium]
MKNQLNELYNSMVCYYSGDPKRIQHFIKVHSFARLIGEMEELDSDTLTTLEAAAYVHDIGIKPAELKYGSSNGKLQEQEGPSAARHMLSHLNFSAEKIDRICYLVGHHHTYTNIDGLDYQILVEADFLVNLFEDGESKETAERVLNKIFKTSFGSHLCKTMFNL